MSGPNCHNCKNRPTYRAADNLPFCTRTCERDFRDFLNGKRAAP